MTDNDTQAQLDALRAKAEGMGLHWASFQVAVTYLLVAIGGEETITQLSPAWLDTAATLLGALDKDAVVVPINTSGDRCFHCGMWNDSYYGGCSANLSKHGSVPGPRCLGPAQPGKKWIMVEVPE